MFTNKPMIIYFVLLNDEVVYIGQTKLTLDKRKSQHEYNAKRNKGYVIGAGIRKHGAENFKWNTHSIYFVQKDLDAAEKHLIAKYSPRYNINLGGETRGVRKKGSSPWNKGTKGAQQAWNKGKKELRPEVLKKISEGAKNRATRPSMSDEHKKALHEGRREKYRITNKHFICIENNKIYTLVIEAAKDLNIPSSGIYAVLDNRLKSYRGFTFKHIQHVRAAL